MKLTEKLKESNKKAESKEQVRTALVAYNAVFDDLGDKSKPEYLVRIVEDAITRGGGKL